MRLYIAGSSSDLKRVKAAQARVQVFNCGETATAMAPGLHVTHDWVRLIEEHGANPPDMDVFQRASWAADDLTGVREADILWVLMPPGMSDGAMWEAGYADALGKYIIISGPGHTRSIFTARARCYDTDESAFEAIVDLYFNETSEPPYRVPRPK